MEAIFHLADSRGSADHGWLQAKHSFSFAGWFNPERMQFGALRVLNDDIVQGSTKNAPLRNICFLSWRNAAC